jgi:hypothetical protein
MLPSARISLSIAPVIAHRRTMPGALAMSIREISQHSTPFDNAIDDVFTTQAQFPFMNDLASAEPTGPNVEIERLSAYCESIGATWDVFREGGMTRIELVFADGPDLITAFGRREDFNYAIIHSRNFWRCEYPDRDEFFEHPDGTWEVLERYGPHLETAPPSASEDIHSSTCSLQHG